jgi:hypothetical protein
VGLSSTTARKFFNHYAALGWKTSTGAKIENWKAKAAEWITSDLQRQRDGKPPPPPKTTGQLQAEAEAKSIKFLELLYQEYCTGAIKEDNLPADYYDFLKAKELLILATEEMTNIFSRCGSDPIKAKKKALAEYFDRQNKAGILKIFQLQH